MKAQFLDLEMLCWENGDAPHGQSKDIIQLGIVEVDINNLQITRKHNYYIRPKNKHFDVSEYCTNLTGITRERLIDEGRYFPDVMRTIKKEFAPQNKITYAWGSDFEPISKQCIEFDCHNPWVEQGIWDFGIIWRSAYNYKYKLSLIEALNSVGLNFIGPQHDALNDAYALAQLHNYMMQTIRNNERKGL